VATTTLHWIVEEDEAKKREWLDQIEQKGDSKSHYNKSKKKKKRNHNILSGRSVHSSPFFFLKKKSQFGSFGEELWV
jgi:hypothetical protein